MSKKKDLGSRVDEELVAMFDAESEPSDGRLKLLNTAIKKLALDARLEESDYGDFFKEDDNGRNASGIPTESARPKHQPRKRENGDDTGAAEPQPEGSGT